MLIKMKIKKNFREKLEKRYQLVLREDKTLAETFRIKLTLVNVLIISFSLFAIGFFLSFLLITKTPIIYLTQEVSSIELQKANRNLMQKVNELEIEVKKLEKKEKQLQSILESVNWQSKEKKSPYFFAQNIAPNVQPKANFTPIFKSPLAGIVSKEFDPLMEHYGVDLVGKENSPVKAIARATVVFSGWTPNNGHVLVLQHGQNFVSIYKHNSTILKKEGNFVQQGETIAINGNSGELSTGPHLHFELWHNGTAQDPEDFVGF
tara:strand:- start:179 stop:967 length:789 start_codon:yes stop_codon:yes gene_type:complete